ncbi:MAG: CPBP family glutamic-type intramembrane protease [Bacteroidota bacterium]
MVRKIVLDTFHRSEEEAKQHSASAKGSKADWKVFIICVLVAFCLTMNKYLGDSSFLYSLLGWMESNELRDRIFHSANGQLYTLTWWVAVLCFFYLAVPVIFIKLFFRERLRDYGLKLKGTFADYPLYLLMLLIMIPLVLYFSRSPGFQARYPFYSLSPGEGLYPNFLIWELLYMLQFCALEFFFRGFMLHGTRLRFGFYSIFVMTIPYCMIHFGKPLPETIAAIIAGIALGVLSLKSRSILLGIAIHCSVAIAMDICALWQKGLL